MMTDTDKPGSRGAAYSRFLRARQDFERAALSVEFARFRVEENIPIERENELAEAELRMARCSRMVRLTWAMWTLASMLKHHDDGLIGSDIAFWERLVAHLKGEVAP